MLTRLYSGNPITIGNYTADKYNGKESYTFRYADEAIAKLLQLGGVK